MVYKKNPEIQFINFWLESKPSSRMENSICWFVYPLPVGKSTWIYFIIRKLLDENGISLRGIKYILFICSVLNSILIHPCTLGMKSQVAWTWNLSLCFFPPLTVLSFCYIYTVVFFYIYTVLRMHIYFPPRKLLSFLLNARSQPQALSSFATLAPCILFSE